MGPNLFFNRFITIACYDIDIQIFIFFVGFGYSWQDKVPKTFSDFSSFLHDYWISRFFLYKQENLLKNEYMCDHFVVKTKPENEMNKILRILSENSVLFFSKILTNI